FDRLADMSAPLNDKTAAGVYGGIGRDVRGVAQKASPEYDRALRMEGYLRQNFLDPVDRGPVGMMSRSDDLATQARAVFDNVPLENSERIVRQSIRRIGRQDPNLAF